MNVDLAKEMMSAAIVAGDMRESLVSKTDSVGRGILAVAILLVLVSKEGNVGMDEVKELLGAIEKVVIDLPNDFFEGGRNVH